MGDPSGTGNPPKILYTDSWQMGLDDLEYPVFVFRGESDAGRFVGVFTSPQTRDEAVMDLGIGPDEVVEQIDRETLVATLREFRGQGALTVRWNPTRDPSATEVDLIDDVLG